MNTMKKSVRLERLTSLIKETSTEVSTMSDSSLTTKELIELQSQVNRLQSLLKEAIWESQF